MTAQKGIENTQPERIADAAPVTRPEPTLQEADEALIAFIRRTQQAHKAARIEAILREPDL